MDRAPARISIIEDSPIHSEWLQTELSDDPTISIVSVDHSGRKGIESVREYKSSLVLVDFQLGDMTGLEVVKRLKLYDEHIKTFMITAHTEASIIDRILKDTNVDAVAVKGSRYFEDYLLPAIHHVIQGDAYIDPSLLNKLRESNKLKGLNNLTKREFEVFIQVNSGKADIEIAEDLSVELAYVKNLKSKITKKTKGDDLDTVLSKLIENTNPHYVT